jgi:hypothetical protein
MTDPDVDYQVRLAAAGSLLRDSKDFEKDDKLTPAERRKRIVELVQKLAMGDAAELPFVELAAETSSEPPVIDSVAGPAHDLTNNSTDE